MYCSGLSSVDWVLALAKSKANADVDAYFKPQIAQTTERVNELQKSLEEVVSSTEGKALMSEISARRKAYVEARKAYFDALKNPDATQADALLNNGLLPAAEAYAAKQKELVQHQHALVNVDSERRFDQQETRLWVLVALGGGGCRCGHGDGLGADPLHHEAIGQSGGFCAGDRRWAVGPIHRGGPQR
jgi:hypothetical protein